jgi:RimJ/RimL family protein N-acetyltransferase
MTEMTPLGWPIRGLRLLTPRLELRWPGDDDLEALAALAAEGISASGRPVVGDWAEGTPAERAASVFRHAWKRRGELAAECWSLHFAVVRDGVIRGVQDISATGFAIRREVATGSWLGLGHQRQGTGTEMRQAVLELAFAGLGADWASSGYYEHNAASAGVSRRLGYEQNGFDIVSSRGEKITARRVILSRDRWARMRAAGSYVPVRIEGLEPCLPLLGAPAGTRTPDGPR